MAMFLFLVGGLQGGYGQWGEVDGERRVSPHPCLFFMADSPLGTWVIEGHNDVTRGVIVVGYLFMCSFAITMGPGM